MSSERRSSTLKDRVAQWETKASEYEAKQHANVFSHAYTGAEPISAAEYGHPVEGSLTDQRGKDAAHWVDHEVDKLVGEIAKIGRENPGTGRVECTFGEIFAHYVDISNTVVGVLMRARRRNRVEYEGEMLFQHKSEAVVITLCEGRGGE